MTADGSADASFQLSLFLKAARQFRLGWHAAYNDVRILTAASDIDRIVEQFKIETGISGENKNEQS